MSKWGVFESGDFLHVMPVDRKRHAVGGHTVSDQCWCKPRVEAHGTDVNVKVIVHNDRERGGTSQGSGSRAGRNA